jgi:hypothetical protein
MRRLEEFNQTFYSIGAAVFFYFIIFFNNSTRSSFSTFPSSSSAGLLVKVGLDLSSRKTWGENVWG